jgi:inosine-uridine nucleoside N-ribohydrolase
MHGSVRRGYGGKEKISAEYNVRADVQACRKVFTAPWDITITPLDTCGLVHLTGDKYQKVRGSKDPVAAAVIENYRIWARELKNPRQVESRSSTLFDTVAVYLAFDQDLVTMEELGIRVTDGGFTKIDENAKRMKVATAWKSMGAFEDLLVKRLTGPTVKPRTR